MMRKVYAERRSLEGLRRESLQGIVNYDVFGHIGHRTASRHAMLLRTVSGKISGELKMIRILTKRSHIM